jgi:hypothetical protein
MSDEMLRTARRTEQELVAELEASPVWKKLQAVRQFIQTFENASGTSGVGDSRGGVVRPLAPKLPTEPKYSTPREGSLTQMVVNGAAEFIRAKKGRATSGEITKYLTMKGIMDRNLPPAKASARVASYLSHSAMFDNVPGQGYGLKDRH